MSEVMVGKVHQKKIWPLTFEDQINQAQNAILEIAFLSAGLFPDKAYFEPFHSKTDLWRLQINNL